MALGVPEVQLAVITKDPESLDGTPTSLGDEEMGEELNGDHFLR